MLLATVVLSAAALVSAAATSAAADPQDPPAAAPEAAPMAVPEEPVPPTGGFEAGDIPADPAPVTAPEAAPMGVPEEPVPPAGGFEVGDAPVAAPTEPAPPLGLEASELPAGPSPAFQEHIDAGLKAFIRGRFSRARGEFEKAYAADPQSAAAAFYLAYANYKVGEPSARMNADKQKARDLFARAYQLDPAFQPVWGRKKE